MLGLENLCWVLACLFVYFDFFYQIEKGHLLLNGTSWRGNNLIFISSDVLEISESFNTVSAGFNRVAYIVWINFWWAVRSLTFINTCYQSKFSIHFHHYFSFNAVSMKVLFHLQISCNMRHILWRSKEMWGTLPFKSLGKSWWEPLCHAAQCWFFLCTQWIK